MKKSFAQEVEKLTKKTLIYLIFIIFTFLIIYSFFHFFLEKYEKKNGECNIIINVTGLRHLPTDCLNKETITPYLMGLKEKELSKLLKYNLREKKYNLHEKLEYLLKQKAIELTKNDTTVEEKVISLAKYFANNWKTNDLTFPMQRQIHNSNNMLLKFIYKAGHCGTRVFLFRKMAKSVNVKTRRFAIHNLGSPISGHTTAQFFDNDKWHYIDVTYAGYFKRNGQILSFDEIKQLNNPLTYLVVLENFSDRKPEDNRLIDNKSRMSSIYTKTRLEYATQYGFADEDINITYELNKPYTFGNIDNSSTDVKKSGIDNNITRQLYFLGGKINHTAYLKNLDINSTYSFEVVPVKKEYGQILKFELDSDCKITSGGVYKYDFNKFETSKWKIDIIPSNSECRLYFKKKGNRRLNIDQINFYKSIN